MTVVAYSAKHRIMASDSRVSHEGTHFSTTQKVFRLKTGALLGFAGDVDVRDLVGLLQRARHGGQLPTRVRIAELRLEFDALLALPSGVSYSLSSTRSTDGSGEWHGEAIRLEDPIAAIGSGAPYAYGAMEHGAAPDVAVRIACRRSLYCGGEVQVEKLRPCVSPTRK